MAPSTEYIILDLICPSLGVVLATMTFAAPVRSLRDRLARGSLGQLNPTPWAVMTGNCLGWISYSFLTKDLFVLGANVPGLMISIWLNFGACKLQYRTYYEQKLRHRLGNAANGRAILSSPNAASRGNGDGNGSDHEYDVEIETVPSTVPHERKVLWVLIIWVAICSFVAHVQLTNYEREQIIGYVVNVNLCFFYAAPLTTMVEVCRTRSAVSIHVRTTVMTILNSFFWLAYGFAVHDPFIYVPNCTGFVFGVMQALLLLMFGSKRNQDDARATQLLPPEGSGDGHDDDSTGADRFDNDDGGLV